jgi:hypothetical protein
LGAFFAINNPYAAIAMRNVTFLGVDAIRDLPSRKLQRLKITRIRSRLQGVLLETMTAADPRVFSSHKTLCARQTKFDYERRSYNL